AELDLVRVVARVPHHLVGDRKHLFTRLAQHVLQVDVAGRCEDVDHRLRRGLDRLRRPVYVPFVSAREGADYRPLHLTCDRVDALEVALARDGEAGLYDVDAHTRQGVGDLELLRGVERHSRALLAVPERGVEEPDVAHASTPSSASSLAPMNGIILRRLEPTLATCDSAELRRPVFRVGCPTLSSSRNCLANAPERMSPSTSRIALRTSSVTILGAVT